MQSCRIADKVRLDLNIVCQPRGTGDKEVSSLAWGASDEFMVRFERSDRFLLEFSATVPLKEVTFTVRRVPADVLRKIYVDVPITLRFLMCIYLEQLAKFDHADLEQENREWLSSLAGGIPSEMPAYWCANSVQLHRLRLIPRLINQRIAYCPPDYVYTMSSKVALPTY